MLPDVDPVMAFGNGPLRQGALVRSPVHHRLIEDVLDDLLVDFCDQGLLHIREVHRCIEISEAREGLLKTVVLVLGIRVGHGYRYRESVLGRRVALDGDGLGAIIAYPPFKPYVAIGGAYSS